MGFILVLLASVAIALPAHAYLDPGSGSYMFQMIMAGLVGGLFSIKLFWRNFVNLVASFIKKKHHGG